MCSLDWVRLEFEVRLALGETRVYDIYMTYSNDFVTTVATIATSARNRWEFLTVEHAVEFAWFSVNSTGDASIDAADLQRHFESYLADVHGVTLPAWMIGA